MVAHVSKKGGFLRRLCRYFYRNTRASGVVPQLSAIMGPCAGGRSVFSCFDGLYYDGRRHFLYVCDGTQCGQDRYPRRSDCRRIGRASTHASKSGVAHFSYANEVELINNLKKLLSYMPQNCEEEAPSHSYKGTDERRAVLNGIIPDSASQPYDIHEVINGIIDANTFHEVHEIMLKISSVALLDWEDVPSVLLLINRLF